MLGYIVKILDCPKAINLSERPHSIGDYGKVVETSRLSVQVKTAHDTMMWYLKGEVEVYSRTPVDLIIKDGKSLPANKQAVDKSISQSSSGFRNSSELHDTYIKVNNIQDRDKATAFYNDRGFVFPANSNIVYYEDILYVVARSRGALRYGTKIGDATYPTGATDITAQVLGVTGAAAFKVGDKVTYNGGSMVGTISNHFPNQTSEWYVDWTNKTSMYYKTHELKLRTGVMFGEFTQQKQASVQAELDDFYSLNKLSPMETQSLEQLKFNKYVEENEGDIVDLSESIDAKLEDLNDLGHTCGDLYIKVKTIAAAMSHSFNICNKETLVRNFNDLEVYDNLFASKEYAALVEATKALDKKIETLKPKL